MSTSHVICRWLKVAIAVVLVVAATEQLLQVREADLIRNRSEMVRVGDSSVRCAIAGSNSNSPLVVLLHSTFDTSDMWRYAIPLLAADFRVLAYDRGGFGFSSARATRWEGQERELLALLDALGEKQPIILVGFSNSSSLARVIASRQPGRVRGLVLLSPFLPEAEPSENRSYHAFRFAGKYLTKQGIGSLIGATRLGEWIGVGGRIPGQPDELWIAKRRINHIWAEFLNVVADHTSVSLAALSAAPIPMPTVLLEEPVRDPIRRAQWITAVDSLAKRVSSNLRRYQLPSEDHMTVLQNRESMLVFASALRDFVREPSVATP